MAGERAGITQIGTIRSDNGRLITKDWNFTIPEGLVALDTADDGEQVILGWRVSELVDLSQYQSRQDVPKGCPTCGQSL